MKNIFKHSLLAAAVLALASLTGCYQNKLDTDQYSGTVALAAIAPNPVMRGGELRIIGSNLETVSEVRFAGGVTVTDITTVAAGPRSEIRLTVPVEGPEVGPVTIVTGAGITASTRFDLQYTEPIVIESFSPAEALSGDEITITGDYLNTVKEVIFGGDVIVTEFVSQSRHELKVTVPANAITGPVIAGDVNEIEDENTIPNRIYSAEELAIGKPTVTKAAKATYKSGDEITVAGGHLDMVKAVNLTGASDVSFTLNEDATALSFNLPVSASDGNIVLVSYAGDEFVAGEIETVTVANLAVASLAKDGRYKAGTEIKLSGSDLDLVTKVEFTGAEATWYFKDADIIAGIPQTAKDGAVTVTLGSGKQAFSPAIELVKPVATGTDVTTAVAGKGKVKVSGKDLDLVTDVKIGDKAQTFVACGFTFADGAITVDIPSAAYTGPITLTAANGDETVTDEITVTYDEAVSISFDQSEYALGKNVSVSGSNLLRIESISIKGKKVVSYSLRADDAMVFALPDGMGPGVYRLDLTLVDGSALTWPVAFSVTAPYTETVIWEGYENMGSWSNQPCLGADGAFGAEGLAIGDIVRIYYTPLADWWQFQVFGGHWEAMTFPELDGSNTVAANNTEAGAQFFAFEVTADNYEVLTKPGGWGGALITQGENVAITGLTFLHFGATETVIYEGPTALTWGDDGRFGLALKYFEDAGADSKLIVYFEQTANWGQVQFNDGYWANADVSFPEIGGAYLTTDNAGGKDVTKIELTVTAALLDHLKACPGDYFGLNTEYRGDGRVGLVIQGSDWIITKIAIQ